MAKSFTASAAQMKPDPRFNSLLVSKFVNCLMWDGKKSTSLRVFYDCMDRIKEKLHEENEMDVFMKAMDNVKPYTEVRSKRVGGATYQVPMPVAPKRQQTLAIRWILAAARGKKGRPIHVSLSDELMSAYKREGTAIQTRENVHRMADANKAFAHFAWSSR